MAIEQRENDWEKRYLDKDTPWEEEEPSYYLKPLLELYAKNSKTILEIGCGLGINATYLSKLGYKVDATDISEKAISLANKNNTTADKNINFYVVDFINHNLNKSFDIIIDKGCMHSFLNQEAYDHFAIKVASNLNENGIWINISGNADNPDDLERRVKSNFPRLTLRSIVQAVEPRFEILEIKRNKFGEKNNFYSWVGIFKKRSYFYE